MEDFDLNDYCSSFLKDKSLGDLIFFKNNARSYSYKDLMISVFSQAKKNSKTFSALKIKSSYELFIHLLAGSFTKKELLILSDKEPSSAILNYQSRFLFSDIIIDQEFIGHSTLEHSNYSIDLNRAAFYILSSGSSGPSKSIGISLNNVYFSAKSVIDFFKMKASDVTFLNLPHHHIGGLMILWRAFFSQSSVTTNEADHYDFISLVPLQLKRFLQDPKTLNKLKKCRAILIGGAALEAELKEAALKHQILLYETYGMSETSSLVMLNGIPLNGQEVKLDSKNHFLIKGPTLCSQALVDSEGFFHTKDIGLQNPDGSFEFKQRSDLLFKSAGELIDPLLIENETKSLPWITNAVLVPLKHVKWTNAGCLIYQLNDHSKTNEDIKTHLKTVLHPHLVPKYFFEAPLNLITDGMKPKRYELLSWAQENYFKELIHYQYFPHTNSKKLMVFFHGFMEDHSDMIPLLDMNLELSYLVIDLPGHGKTKTSSFKDREDIFSTLKDLIQFYQNDNELIVYGYSMGGRIALELSTLYLKPELLILESAHFGIETKELKASRLNADRKLLTDPSIDLKTFFIKWYENPIFANYNQHIDYENGINKKLNFDSSQWQESMEFFSPGVTPLLQSEMIKKSMDLKILGITGNRDLKYNEHYKFLQKNLPNFTSLEISQAGHNPHKTHLEELKNILKNYIIL